MSDKRLARFASSAAGLFGHAVVAFVVCCVVFSLALSLSALVPREGMQGNVEESLATLQAEGVYPSACGGDARWRSDNYTTALMLNTAISTASGDVRGTFLGNRAGDSGEDQIADLTSGLYGTSQVTASYARYWHGWLLVIRPLLLVLNLMQIRQVLFFVVTALLVALCCLLYRTSRSMVTAMAPAVSFAAIAYPVVCFSPSFAFSFIIALISSCMVCLDALRGGSLFSSNDRRLSRLPIFFYVVGGVTVYFDFLDNPIVSLGFPLAIYVFVHRDSLSLRKAAMTVLSACVFWCAGYVTLWVAKWAITSVAFNQNVFADAIGQAEFRTSSEGVGGADFTRLGVVALNFNLMFPAWLTKALAALLGVCCVSLAFLFRAGKVRKPPCAALAALVVLSLIPYLWYFGMSNHSYIHSWFTWRNQSVTLLCLILALRLLFPVRGEALDEKAS